LQGYWRAHGFTLAGNMPNTEHESLSVMRALCLALIAMACTVMPAQAATWRDVLPDAQALGSGELRWFGLRVYTARLWSERQPFDAGAPFALELTYHLGISRQTFVATSLDEIERLFGKRYDAATLKRWEGEMNRAFTDVRAGDQLVGVFMPGQGCRFYSRSRLLAEIRDTEFAGAFFAIWFDERTRKKDLRAQLLGSRR